VQLRAGKYNSVQEWRDDIQLIWDNAKKYNGEDHHITNLAMKLASMVEKRWPDAVTTAKENMTREIADPRPRKSSKPRTTELQGLQGSQPASSESDSMDEPATAGAAAAAAGRVSAWGCDALANATASVLLMCVRLHQCCTHTSCAEYACSGQFGGSSGMVQCYMQCRPALWGCLWTSHPFS
jgi:hypothetical protein